ncbi:hypothetical protein [Rhodanobacter sp. FW106-PBR-R2A-1-13]|uniref:hypothetical protein n=1 Tax=Rhodanobacter sp. FW106-PBR-R2A-1-13 TaxID=3454845 RepID=UPI0034E4FB22
MYTTLHSRVLISRLFAIAVSAEHAAHEIRQVMPDWQPDLVFGFQGRLVLVIAEARHECRGVPFGDCFYMVVGAGTDGDVREAAVRFHDGMNGSYGEASSGRDLTVQRFNAMLDEAMSHAMPVSFLAGQETCTCFQVRSPWLLSRRSQERLRDYSDAGVAPHVSTFSEGAESQWSIHWSLLSAESFYAMCEVVGGATVNVFSASERGTAGAGLKYLGDAYQRWSEASSQLA